MLDGLVIFDKVPYIFFLISVAFMIGLLVVMAASAQREVKRLKSKLTAQRRTISPVVVDQQRSRRVKHRVDELFDGFEASFDNEAKKW